MVSTGKTQTINLINFYNEDKTMISASKLIVDQVKFSSSLEEIKYCQFIKSNIELNNNPDFLHLFLVLKRFHRCNKGSRPEIHRTSTD